MPQPGAGLGWDTGQLESVEFELEAGAGRSGGAWGGGGWGRGQGETAQVH